MIDLRGSISMPFLNKSRFTGSYRGMRYVLQKKEKTAGELRGDGPGEAETVLEAVVWPEPMNYEHTPDEKKHRREFPFDGDGLAAAIGWLNAEHGAGHFYTRE